MKKLFKNKKVPLFAIIAILIAGGFFWYINNYAERSSASATDINVSLIANSEVNIDGTIEITLEASNPDYNIVASDLFLSYDSDLFTFDKYEQVTPDYFDDELTHEVIDLDGSRKAVHLIHLKTQDVAQNGVGLLRYTFIANKVDSTNFTILTTTPNKSAIYGIHKTTNQPIEFTFNPVIITKLITIAPPTTLTPTNTPVPPTTTRIPTETPTPVANSCPNFSNGSALCDSAGAVNLKDFACWRYEFVNRGALTTVDGVACRSADFNTDGNTNLFDFTIWRIGFINANRP